MQFLAEIISPAAGIAGLVALAVGVSLGRRGRHRLAQRAEELAAENARLETQCRENSRHALRTQNEHGALHSLMLCLPSVVRDINRHDLSNDRVPDLLVRLANAIFQPKQVLLYLARDPDTPNGRVRELYLQHSAGLDREPEEARIIPIGVGKIGFVAENRVEMNAEDWLNLSRREGLTVADNHHRFALDLIGPLVHHSELGERLLGVLCVGDPAVRPRDEKMMLQMVTNIGSIALMKAARVGELTAQANHDGLTGLLNKRKFMTEIGTMMIRAEQTGRPLGIFIFDIDHFKCYNDTNGHLAGDELLKTMAKLLRQNLRPGDVACRYGGEEFVVAMPNSDGEIAERVAERIRRAVDEFPFPHGASQPEGNLTISGGVAAFPYDGTNGTELLNHADKALYQAKAAGRNRVMRYEHVDLGDPGMDPWETYYPSDSGLKPAD